MAHVQEHGSGPWGILVTFENGRQFKYWSKTENEREADFKVHRKMPDVKNITRIKK